jgi:hypothetical protein
MTQMASITKRTSPRLKKAIDLGGILIGIPLLSPFNRKSHRGATYYRELTKFRNSRNIVERMTEEIQEALERYSCLNL